MEVGITTSNSLAAQLQSELKVLANDAGQLAAHANLGRAAGEALPAGFSFTQSMKNALDSVNQQDAQAGQKMNDVDSGKSDDLVGAMLASQEASLSFSMLMQVRNKVMGAVDELIKLPV
ncbi:flagellar hook-basal body complex protein FliE [Massilia sp. DJPM01]|uniref:flagellar hook-basal body complex protein FliE n=1 Tax=Massilia sp. DJPM01 TaxID=3024404 RepID=UPI00259DFF87|nr:flagellar hook-basal body complex protein FliE [Massilia sp. DJPM01]MDM5178449.1 flagellar hook-basal body complex protein FliE [Massilia sp. DJPM01]